MSVAGWAQLAALALFVISTPLIGRYLYRVYFGSSAPGDRVLLPIERLVYRTCGIDAEGEQRWRGYAVSLLSFSLVTTLFSYAVLRWQAHLPFNPDGMTGVSPGFSFNTAVSFLMGTNRQSYVGEATMSHLSQMLALTIHQFLGGAVGIAVAVALMRGLSAGGNGHSAASGST